MINPVNNLSDVVIKNSFLDQYFSLFGLHPQTCDLNLKIKYHCLRIKFIISECQRAINSIKLKIT